MARKIGAVKYMECSAQTCEGVRELFESATRLALLRPIRKKRKNRLSSFFNKIAERSASPRLEAAKGSNAAGDGAGTTYLGT